MSHAVMPLADYVGACDVIREKTGGTEPITSGELAEQIGAVHTAGKLAALESAEVLKGNLFGNPVTATAVTPITHNTGARLESKNLFDASLFNKNTADGITVEHEGDGVFHIYGSTPANSIVQDKVCWLDLPCEANKNYTLSATLLSGTLGHFVIPFFGVGAEPHTVKNWLNVEINQNTEIGTTVTHTGKPSETGALHGFEANYITRFWFYFGINTDPYEMDCRIRVQLELGTVATPYTPFVSDFTKVRTRNLFNEELYTDYSHSHKGITVDYEGSGIFHVHGSATESGFSTRNLYFAIPVSEGDTFTESVEYLSGSTEIPMYMFFGTSATEGNTSNWMNCQINSSTVAGNTVTRTSTIPSGANYITAFWFYSTASSGAVDIRVRVQLEKGTEATPYVPYTIPAVVTKRGKNVFDADKLVNSFFVKNQDGTYTATRISGERFTNKVPVNIPKGTEYVIYYDTVETTLTYTLVWYTHHSDGTSSTTPNSKAYRFDKKDIVAISLFLEYIEPEGNYITVKDFRVNLRTRDPNYEPYTPPITYPADAEGNLGEVPSISPTMILECPDVEGVNIVAHYLKDIDGAFEERLAELEAAIVEIA